MAKRSLSTELRSNPTVRLADKVGSRFVGRYLASKDIKIKNKPSKLYEFAALDGDALITIKDEKGGYREADIKEGDTVSLFGSKALDAGIALAKVGEVLEIIFNGEKKLSSGNTFNDFAIAVVEDEVA